MQVRLRWASSSARGTFRWLLRQKHGAHGRYVLFQGLQMPHPRRPPCVKGGLDRRGERAFWEIVKLANRCWRRSQPYSDSIHSSRKKPESALQVR